MHITEISAAATQHNLRLRNPGCKGAFRFVLTQHDSWLALDEASDCNMFKACEQPFYLRRGMYASATTLLGQPGPQPGLLPHL